MPRRDEHRVTGGQKRRDVVARAEVVNGVRTGETPPRSHLIRGSTRLVTDVKNVNRRSDRFQCSWDELVILEPFAVPDKAHYGIGREYPQVESHCEARVRGALSSNGIDVNPVLDNACAITENW